MASLDRDRWRAVGPYLDRAMEMTPDELAAWLPSVRAEHPSLAADLEMLLSDREAIGREGFLEDSEEAPPPSLTSIGPYRLIRVLGEGGMGTVYLAEQTEPIRREVALKVIRPGLDSERVLARFAVERQILAKLDHPGIAKIHDAGATPDGRPYVAMEYVAGPPLTGYCDDGRLTLPERLRLFVQVCAAIQHAHQKGVIHRDIKPSNLLVSVVDGRPVVKVIDFGIAKALHPSPEEQLFTQTGTTLGTPEYMSPEQASPDGDDVDTRSDVYGLGVVLYELLAGARPFEARDLSRPTPLSLLQTVRDREPPRLSVRLLDMPYEPGEVAARRGTDLKRLVRQLSGELEWITTKALEKQPARRYASAAELAADVQRYLKGEPVLAGPPSTLYRLRKLARRHRAAVTALAIVAATILIGGVVSSLALLRAVRAERIGRVELRESLLNQARVLTNSGELDRRTRALDALRDAAAIAPGLDARDAAIAALVTPGFHVRRPWSALPEGTLFAWPDAGLTRYARGNSDGSVSLHAIDDDAELLRLPPVSAVANFGCFSRDGRWLAVDHEHQDLRVWDLASRTSRQLLGSVGNYGFTPDSRQLVATSKGDVHLFDASSGRELRRLKVGLTSDVWIAVHPSEPRFLVGGYGSRRLEIRRTGDGALERALDVPELGLAARWSADGRSLITAHRDFSIRVWDWPFMDAARLVLRFHGAEPLWLSTDPSGRWLATAAWDNQIAFFDLRDGRLLLSHPGTRVVAAFDRPAFFLVNGEEWSLIEFEPAATLQTLPLHESGKSPRALAFSPNGRWLATAGEDGIRLLDLRSREVRRLVEDAIVACPAFKADGSELRAIAPSRLLAWRIGSEPREDRLLDPLTGLPGIGNAPAEIGTLWGLSRDGERWIAADTDPRTHRLSWILGRFDSTEILRAKGFDPGANGPELSTDGRWAAWGNWHGRDAAVARLDADAPPVRFAVTGAATVAFSPDERRLFVGGPDEVRSYEVGTWRLQYTIPRRPRRGLSPHFAFTKDSRLGAVALTDRVLLFATSTGRELGTLPASEHVLSGLDFSPDGRMLAVASTDHHVLIWDLASLRGRLKELGLDWEP